MHAYKKQLFEVTVELSLSVFMQAPLSVDKKKKKGCRVIGGRRGGAQEGGGGEETQQRRGEAAVSHAQRHSWCDWVPE